MEKNKLSPDIRRSRSLTAAFLASIAFSGASSAETSGSDRDGVRVVADKIENRIQEKKPVNVSFRKDVSYDRAGQERSTILPLKAKIDGQTRYFYLTQNGDNLNSLEVKSIPSDAESYQGSYLYNEDLSAKTVNSGRSVIHMDLEKNPVVGIGYDDGSETYQIAGEEVKNFQTQK